MRAIFLLIGMLVLNPASHAGEVSLPNTETLFLKSPQNDVEYKIYVSYPADLNAGNGNYPLIISLDPDYSFAIIRNIVEHLSDRNDIPPVVVASIGYAGETTMRSYRMNRSRDYTPVFDPDDGYGKEFQAESGGGKKFLNFIEEELIPLLQERFGATGKRVLVGHSYGGLFTSYAMLERPSLFQGYIAVSPSLWYHDHWIFQREKSFAQENADLPVQAYFAVGDHEINGNYNMVRDLRNYAAQLRSRNRTNLELRNDLLTDETHNSIFPRAVSNGIRFIWPRN